MFQNNSALRAPFWKEFICESKLVLEIKLVWLPGSSWYYLVVPHFYVGRNFPNWFSFYDLLAWKHYRIPQKTTIWVRKIIWIAAVCVCGWLWMWKFPGHGRSMEVSRPGAPARRRIRPQIIPPIVKRPGTPTPHSSQEKRPFVSLTEN